METAGSTTCGKPLERPSGPRPATFRSWPDAALYALDYRPCKPTKRTQSEINAINRMRMLGPHREVAMGAL